MPKHEFPAEAVLIAIGRAIARKAKGPTPNIPFEATDEEGNAWHAVIDNREPFIKLFRRARWTGVRNDPEVTEFRIPLEQLGKIKLVADVMEPVAA